MAVPGELGALELLGDLVAGEGGRRIGLEGVQDVGVRPDLVAEHGRVAHAVQEAVPRGVELAQHLAAEQVVVADDQELARQVDEGRQVVHDHQVQIEEQGRAAQVGEGPAEQGQLAPAGVRMPWWQPQFGQRQRFHAGHQAVGVVGEADEAEGPAEVTPDPREQVVDVLGAVAAAPFHAQHVDDRGHRLSRAGCGRNRR